jgi:5-methylcytosine-specific restriction endonuclease McrA
MTQVFAQPKPKREKMTPRKWEERRIEVWERECGLCQGCFRFVPLTDGHIHHIKTRGAGGGDEMSNLCLLCFLCHDAVHRGLIKLGGENG